MVYPRFGFVRFFGHLIFINYLHCCFLYQKVHYTPVRRTYIEI